MASSGTEREGSGSESGDPDQKSDDHSVYGPCPWNHRGRLGPDCGCECNKCRNTRQRPVNYDFQRGYYNRPKRVIHGRPPTPGPNVAQRCTEMTPWATHVENWIEQCEHSRILPPRPGTQVYTREIRGCVKCGERPDEEMDGLNEFSNKFPIKDDPPAVPEGSRFVCQDHIKDSKKFWELDKLYKANRVGTCRECRERLKARYTRGLNTCTCSRLFERWQCRRCFEQKVFKVQNHFRRRVLAEHRGGGVQTEGREKDDRGKIRKENKDFVLRRDYHLSWRRVRAIVARRHPCSHRCGKKRILSNEVVMDCRACGGTIVRVRNEHPLVERVNSSLREKNAQYSFRHARGSQPLLQLDDRGRPVQIQGTAPDRFTSSTVVPTTALPQDEDGSDDGDEFTDFWTHEHSPSSQRRFGAFTEVSKIFKDGPKAGQEEESSESSES